MYNYLFNNTFKKHKQLVIKSWFKTGLNIKIQKPNFKNNHKNPMYKNHHQSKKSRYIKQPNKMYKFNF